MSLVLMLPIVGGTLAVLLNNPLYLVISAIVLLAFGFMVIWSNFLD